MTRPRVFLCGEIDRRPSGLPRGAKVVDLRWDGPDPNVLVKFEDVSKAFSRVLEGRIKDLIEIAAYVYTADSATSRGKGWEEDGAVEEWERDFTFIVPVRDVEFWRREDIRRLLVEALGFMSDDRFSFEFVSLKRDRPSQSYLGLDTGEWAFDQAADVVMFSGGLDSLSGAVELASQGKNLVLVSHRAVSKLSSRQVRLFKEMRAAFPAPKMVHVPVWVYKRKASHEFTQRTRSFLYAALGIAVGEFVRAERALFFENGVVSLNLPIADEVLRARASRTTHPLVLQYLSELASAVLGRSFRIENPYIFRTKTEVLRSLADRGGAHLIPLTCSCARQGIFTSRTQWHCGTCSQCIDRRVAVLAAGLEGFDPAADYVTDVFLGPREPGPDRSIAVHYVRHATELAAMNENEFVVRFNRDLARAVQVFPDPREAAEEIFAMHKRHANSVMNVLKEQLQAHLSELLEGTLKEGCMLQLIAGRAHREPLWRSYAQRIGDLLQEGLPRAVEVRKPNDERELQSICDGILQAHRVDLTREYPFMRWGSALTKPDWSDEDLRLWVELKYVRTKADVRRITEDIASDITKYGDSGRRVLFVVYDPYHLVVDERGFRQTIESHEGMMVRFVR